MVISANLQFHSGAQYGLVRRLGNPQESPDGKSQRAGEETNHAPSATPLETPEAIQSTSKPATSFEHSFDQAFSFTASSTILEVEGSLGQTAKALLQGAMTLLGKKFIPGHQTDTQHHEMILANWQEAFSMQFSHNRAQALVGEFMSGSLGKLLLKWHGPAEIEEMQRKVRRKLWRENRRKMEHLYHEKVLHEVVG